jgi:hypothetical protein
MEYCFRRDKNVIDFAADLSPDRGARVATGTDGQIASKAIRARRVQDSRERPGDPARRGGVR